MRAPAVSFVNKLCAAALAALLMFTLLPASAFAEGEGETADASTEEFQEVSAPQSDASSGVAPMLASGLVGNPTTFINSDVTLDGEPVIGSFTVDGMTFAVTEGSSVELVGVSSGWQQVVSSQEGDGSPVAPMLASGPDGSTLSVPESITYEGVDYIVSSIGAYAFYLSGVASVELPASIAQVDDRAFRSSDVVSVSVADGNPSYSSFDGALYDAAQLSLLLIPEGKQGTVLLPKTAESAAPSVFSHCPLVTQISVEEGSAAFASENGLLYDASLATLLRVPAGATDITIHDGCTTIAAGAMEACASLATITAPASVTSISPDVFTSVPTVSLPATTLVEDAPQLSAMVALSSTDDDLPEVNGSMINVLYGGNAQRLSWRDFGLLIENQATTTTAAKVASGAIYAADPARFVSVNNYQRGYLTATASYNVPQKYYSDTSSVGIYAGATSASYRLTSTNAGKVGGYGTYALYPASSYAKGPQGDGYTGGGAYARTGYKFMGWNTSATAIAGSATLSSARVGAYTLYAIFVGVSYSIELDVNGGVLPDGQMSTLGAVYGEVVSLPIPERPGYRFVGWETAPDGTGDLYAEGSVSNLTSIEGEVVVLHAQWERLEYDLGFEVDSEPGDEDYPGIDKPDETVNVESGPTVIEDPKRPGYVFQGWTIPNAEGTEAIDQDLVYKDEADGKWYVDASKLPDYANDEGRVELTAHWTSVISVDVPSAVTFYADVVTQGNESREGAASSAFGQNKVASQSEVDLRIVGLESTAVETQGSTLGADSILKKSASATPSSSTQKLFSLYPTDKALTADDLQDPDAVSQAKPADAVDFALDDILLEKSFSADSFTIPAGDTLNLGYRLNLAETGTELDYDTLTTLDEGTSASIANISYTFAADYASPADWGEPLWIENPDTSAGAPRFLVLDDIKAAAEDLSANGESSVYYDMYKDLLDRQVTSSGNPGVGPYFQLKVDGVYWDLQLIGICQDTRSDGAGKAGLTFQMRDLFSWASAICYPGSGAYVSSMNASDANAGGWNASSQRALLRSAFWEYLDAPIQSAIVPVDKFQQVRGGAGAAYLQGTPGETIWLPSMYEVFGAVFANYNGSEGLATVAGYAPFQYMAYQGNDGSMTNVAAMKKHSTGAASGSTIGWWLRSAYQANTAGFCNVNQYGLRDLHNASSTLGIAPAFCL